MKKIKLMVAAAIIFNANLSNSASFDCAKASSFNEKTVCSNPSLSKQDEQMAGLYKELVKIFGDTLKIQQRQWNKEVRACKDEKCIANLYRNRIDEFTQVINKTLYIETIIVRKSEIQRDYSVDLTVDRLDYNQKGRSFTLMGDIGEKSFDYVQSTMGKPIIVNFIMDKDCQFCIVKVTPYIK
jgi:uncharacterized protein